MRCATAAPSSATPVFVFRKHNLIMTEARILDLLYSLEGKQEPLPKGAQYMAEYVETISKNLATYFHKSAKVQNTSIANKRLDLIVSRQHSSFPICNLLTLQQVLQKWCVKKSSHFDINEQNFHCFLNALTKHHVEEWISDFKKELEEEQKQLDATFATELVKFYTSQNEENKRKHETNDEIIKYERQQFLEDNFDFTFSRCIQNDDIESFLNLLILEDKANTNKNEENKTSEIKNKFELTQYRESQINAAYSLLNLEKTDETEVFYLELLTKLKSFKLLNSEELMLLEYLFLKSGKFITIAYSEIY